MLWEKLDLKKMEREVPAPSPRQFVIVLAVAITLIYFFKRHQSWSLALLVIAVLLCICGFLCPHFLKIPSKYWHRLGLFLSWLTSPIILSFMFALTIVPTAILLKIFGHKALAEKGHWIERKNKKCKFDRSF